MVGLEQRPAPGAECLTQGAGRRSALSWPVGLLLLALVLGAGLRFFGLNWDDGAHLHPDERQIVMVASGLHWPTDADAATAQQRGGHSALDPHFFAYGSLPLYLLAIAGNLAHWLGAALAQSGLQSGGLTRQLLAGDAYEGMPLVGRFLSALFDTVSIYLCFLIGRRLYGAAAGALAAFAYAVTMLAIQQAHFYVVDPILTFFVLLTVLFSLRALQDGRPADAILSGIFYGCAVATKVSAAPLGLVVFLAQALPCWRVRGMLDLGRRYRIVGVRASGLLLALAAAVGTFLVTEPYAILDWQQFSHDLSEQSAMVRGVADFPYTRQYAPTQPYLYWLQGLITWQLTPPLALAGLAGLGWQTWRALRARFDREKLVVAWWLPYLLVTGAFYAKFPRYLLPAAPFLCLAAAGVLWRLAGGASGDTREPLASTPARFPNIVGELAKRTWGPVRARWVAAGLLALVLLVATLYCFAYANIYATTNTRVAASDWMYQHIPATSAGHQTVLSHEVWDDALPLDRGRQQPDWTGGRFASVDLPIYDDDNAAKQQALIAALQRADYVVEASEIVRGSILRNPSRYPMTTAYYRALADGNLGFQQVVSFRSVPTLFGLRLDDRTSDLNWQYYDHPPVTIYQKVRQVSPEAMAALLPLPLAPPTQAQEPATPSLALTPKQQAADAEAPALGELFPTTGLGMRVPLPVWLVTVELLGLLALPWSIRLLRALPDAGYSAAKTLGILLLAWGTWLPASVGIARNARGTIVAVLGGLLLACLVGWWRLDSGRELLRRKWRLWLLSEGVFLAAFGLFLWIRAFNPDLWQLWHGGEKPMELSYLHAILRSQTLPPYDPWLAGTTINYYYFGLFVIATLLKLTRIAPEIGFNLALPLVYGLAMQLAAAAGYALCGLLLARSWAVQPERPAGGGVAPTRSGIDGEELNPTERTRWPVVPTERLDRRAALGALAALLLFGILGNIDSGPYVLGLLQQSGAKTIYASLPILGGLAQVVVGFGQAIGSGGNSLPAFNFFDRTRVIPNTINEFPFFSFLYADLHPHVIDLPFELLAATFAVALVAGSRRLRNIPIEPTTVLLGGLLIGVLWPNNVWDYPTFLLLAVGAMAVRHFDGQDWRSMALPPLLLALALFAVSRLAFLPFYQHFYALDSGLGLPMHHSDLGSFLRVYGLFLFIAGSALLVERQLSLERLALLLLPAVLTGLVSGSAVLALLVGLLCLLLRAAWLRRFQPNILAAFLLLGLALCVVLGTEVVFVKDPLAGGDAQRMNTVFKFGMQAWILLSLSCGPLLVWLVSRQPLPFFQVSRRAAPVLLLASDREAFTPVPARRGVLAGAGAAEISDWRVGPTAPPGAATVERVRPAQAAAPAQPVLQLDGQGPVEGTSRLVARDTPATSGNGQGHDGGGWQRAVPAAASVNAAASVDGVGNGAIAGSPASDGSTDAPSARDRSFPRWSVPRSPLAAWWWSVLGLLALSAVLYPLLATPAHERDRWDRNAPTPSLAGMAFMRVNYPADYAAISWLQEHVSGDPVLLEANKDLYSWYGRVSWFTGLPTVLGWDYHTSQFHDPAVIPIRKQAITTIYTTPDVGQALNLLHRYDVGLIYVGPLEQETYVSAASQPTVATGDAGLAKFDRMVGDSLDLIYSSNGVKIYRVRSGG